MYKSPPTGGRKAQWIEETLVHKNRVVKNDCNSQTFFHLYSPFGDGDLSSPRMQVHRSMEALPSFTNAVITIGSFDGVHLGHQKIIAALKEAAKINAGETVIITFDPHPRKIVQPEKPMQLLNTLDEKIELLQRAGINHLVVVPFTQAFSEQTADEYIENFLVKNFRPSSIIIGYDHHFGKGRTGNYKTLEERSGRLGYRLLEIPQHVLNEIEISSSKIRKAVLASDVATAARLLGYSFFFEGLVVKGDQLGRTLGYPTANLQYTDGDKIQVGHGVFAVNVEINGVHKKGMMSIGTRPTLNKSEEKIEVNLFNFDGDLYGKTLRVSVEHFLRRQEKYSSLEKMVEQIHEDKAQSLSLLK